MTNKSKHGTSVLPYWLLSGDAASAGAMIERSYFEDSHAVNNSPDYLTQDELLSMLEPYAHIPLRGERSIQSMQDQWQGTPIGEALHELSSSEAVSAAEVWGTIDAYFRNEDNRKNDVSVVDRWVTRAIDEAYVTDRKYHLDWQGRAMAYRVAAEQAVGTLPVKNFDGIGVTFTSRMLGPNTLLLIEYRGDTFADPPFYTEHVHLRRKQYRLIEQMEDGRFVEQATIPLLQIEKQATARGSKPITLQTVLLDERYPARVFDKHKHFGIGLPTVYHDVLAPMQSDLRIPEDMPYDAEEWPDEETEDMNNE